MKRYVIIGFVFLLVVFAASYRAGAGVKGTKHDLSFPTGTTSNTYYAADPTAGGTTQICIFCHTPHNSKPNEAPLWNRAPWTASYLTYTSDVLAGLGYPAPEDPMSHVKTRICLSCHDGTIALGSVVNMPKDSQGGFTQIQMSGGNDKITGSSAGFIGTDLRDDHPVAIKHLASGAGSDPELKTSIDVNSSVRLYTIGGAPTKQTNDPTGDYVECTSCHDAHDNTWGNFLIESNLGSQICIDCHNKQKAGAVSPTAHDVIGVGAVLYDPDGKGSMGTTVGQVQCMNCHYSHKSGIDPAFPNQPNTNPGYGKYLLSFQEESTCFNLPNRWGRSSNVCHASGSTTKDIKSQEYLKSSAHMDSGGYMGKHTATEHGKGNSKYGWLSGNANWHVQCADCHNAHTAGKVNHTKGTNVIGPDSPLYGAGGVSVTFPGSWPVLGLGNYSAFESLGVTDSTSMPLSYYEYQICFKCHSNFAWGDNPLSAPLSPSLGGATNMTNQAQEFSTANKYPGASAHPIAGVTGHIDGTLLSPWNVVGQQGNQTMYCSDCHSSEAGSPNGPHGSNATYGDNGSFTKGFILVSNYTDTYSNTKADAQLSTDLCFNCHDKAVYLTGIETPAGTSTGFRDGTYNLHLRHVSQAVAGATSNYAYRCVNCHTKIPHGYKNKAMIVTGADGGSVATYAAGGNAKITSASLVNPPYGTINANCSTVSGCHQ